MNYKQKQQAKKSILEASQKLQNLPVFKIRQTKGFTLNFITGTMKPKKFTDSPESQKRSYILRWLAEPLYCSMDSPRPVFYKHLETLKSEFKNDPAILKSLSILELNLSKIA